MMIHEALGAGGTGQGLDTDDMEMSPTCASHYLWGQIPLPLILNFSINVIHLSKRGFIVVNK